MGKVKDKMKKRNMKHLTPGAISCPSCIKRGTLRTMTVRNLVKVNIGYYCLNCGYVEINHLPEGYK